MNKTTTALRIKADRARQLLKRGDIDIVTAKAEIQPYIDVVNKRAKELAKKYGVTFKPVSTTGFLR